MISSTSFSLKNLATIRSDQYWVIAGLDDQETTIACQEKPQYICFLIQAIDFAHILYAAEKILSGTNIDNEAKSAALNNLASRYIHFTQKLSYIEQVITDIALWIIGFREENSIQAIAGRINESLDESLAFLSISPYHDKALLSAEMITQTTTPKRLYYQWLIPPSEKLQKMVSLCIEKLDSLLDYIEKHNSSSQEFEIWSEPYVLKIADEVINLAYATNVLQMRELPLFQKKVEEKLGMKKSLIECLTDYDYSFNQYMFFILPKVYRIFQRKDIYESDTLKKCKTKGSPEFYQEGTIQNTWRLLYNNYCRIVNATVSRKRLEEVDRRFTRWTQYDNQINDFNPFPGTLPGT